MGARHVFLLFRCAVKERSGSKVVPEQMLAYVPASVCLNTCLPSCCLYENHFFSWYHCHLLLCISSLPSHKGHQPLLNMTDSGRQSISVHHLLRDRDHTCFSADVLLVSFRLAQLIDHYVNRQAKQAFDLIRHGSSYPLKNVGQSA